MSQGYAVVAQRQSWGNESSEKVSGNGHTFANRQPLNATRALLVETKAQDLPQNPPIRTGGDLIRWSIDDHQRNRTHLTGGGWRQSHGFAGVLRC